jgi:hypothetical protein
MNVMRNTAVETMLVETSLWNYEPRSHWIARISTVERAKKLQATHALPRHVAESAGVVILQVRWCLCGCR